MIEYQFHGGPLDGERIRLPREAYDITIRYAPDDDDDAQATIDLGRLDSDYYRLDDSDESQPVLTWTANGVWTPV